MQLTGRLVLIVMLVISLLTAAYGYLTVQREDRQLKDQMRREAQTLGRTLEEQVVLRWRENGHDGVIELARQTSVRYSDLGVRWVRPEYIRSQIESPRVEVLDVQPGESLSIVEQAADGVPYLRTYYPVEMDQQPMGFLEFSESLHAVQRYTRRTIVRTIALVGSILIFGCVVALVGVRLVGRPLQALIQKTERIGTGDFSAPLQLRGYAELSQLAEALNKMCGQLAESQRRLEAESAARVATLEQLRHADRLKTVGRLASGVAHELGTPLNVVSGRAELIASGQLGAEDVKTSAQAIKKEADRMAAIIRQLLDFARRNPPRRATIDLSVVARRSLDLLGPLAHKRNVRLELSGDRQPHPASVDPDQIQQVLTNLIDNAIQAMPAGGPVRLELRRQRASRPSDNGDPPGDYHVLVVEDRGAGIPEDDLNHIFEPFFTTKDVGEGTGLGLSVSFGIVEDHGGWIDVWSQPGEGSRFSVFLPAESPAPETLAPETLAPETSGRWSFPPRSDSPAPRDE